MIGLDCAAKLSRLLIFVIGIVGLLVSVAHALEVEDDSGASIKLDQVPQRIISLAPFTTELIYALGAQDRLIAVSEYSDYPLQAKTLPRVSNAFAINIESVISMKADLVIAWKTGGDSRGVARLRNLGIPVYLSEPRALTDVASTLKRLGILLGVKPQAQQVAQSFSDAIGNLEAAYANKRLVRVFYQIARKPLMTLNGEHMVSRVLEICGGINAFDGVEALAPVVTREQVLTRDPQVILISSTIEQSDELIARWESFKGMSAAKYENIFLINSSLLNRQTPRLIQGAEQVCELLERARGKLK